MPTGIAPECAGTIGIGCPAIAGWKCAAPEVAAVAACCWNIADAAAAAASSDGTLGWAAAPMAPETAAAAGWGRIGAFWADVHDAITPSEGPGGRDPGGQTAAALVAEPDVSCRPADAGSACQPCWAAACAAADADTAP